MKIDAQNIDQYLFEYFEGELSHSQQDALMQYIHTHPEYETNFVQWKKTYHHTDHKLEDYGIVSSLQKNVYNPWYYPWYYRTGVLSIGLASALMLWYSISVSDRVELHSATLTTPDLHSNIKISSTKSVPLAHDIHSSLPSTPASITGSSPSDHSRLFITSYDSLAIIAPAPELSLSDHPVAAIADVPAVAIAPVSPLLYVATHSDTGASISASDTMVSVAPIDHDVPSAKATPKKKTKTKGVFRTTDKYIPVNKNF